MQLNSWAVVKTTAVPGRRFGGTRLVIGALALSVVMVGRANAANEAEGILQKVNAAYTTAHTYEGSVTTIKKGRTPDGKSASVTVAQHLLFKDTGKFMVTITSTMTGGPKVAHDSKTVISDGINVTVYVKSVNKYQVQPLSSRKVTLMQLLNGVVPGPVNSGCTMLPPTSVNGRPAYLVQFRAPTVKDITPPVTPAKLAQLKVYHAPQLSIDKQNYHILKIAQSVGPSSADVIFGSQTMNGPIADSNFKFTAPPGAKPVAAPAPRGPMPHPFPAPAPHK